MVPSNRVRTTIVVALFLSLITADGSKRIFAANGLKLFASNGVKAAVETLQSDAERAIGLPLRIQFDTSASLKQRIDAGEPFDVAIVTAELMDELTRSGRLAATRAAIARSGIGVGIRKGAPKPDIGTAAGMKRTLTGARAITFASEGASRMHILAMLDRLGIAEEMKPKTILARTSIDCAAKVTGGEADIILTLVSEILPIKGVDLAGPLPGEFQHYVVLTAGVSATTVDTTTAQKLVTFLASPAATKALKANGMEKP